MLTTMGFMLEKRQGVVYNDDSNDDDGLWGYSTVSFDSHLDCRIFGSYWCRQA